MAFEQDYILRLIQNIGAMLRRILELVHLGSPSAAVEQSEHAVALILGVDASVADAMAVESLVTFLRVGAELDVPRAILLARVFSARALGLEALGDAEGAARQRTRAGELLALARPDATPEESEEIDGLLGEVFSAE